MLVVIVVVVVVLPKEGKASDAIVAVKGIFVENFTIVIAVFWKNITYLETAEFEHCSFEVKSWHQFVRNQCLYD